MGIGPGEVSYPYLILRMMRINCCYVEGQAGGCKGIDCINYTSYLIAPFPSSHLASLDQSITKALGRGRR